jgi:hypothetical protein
MVPPSALVNASSICMGSQWVVFEATLGKGYVAPFTAS